MSGGSGRARRWVPALVVLIALGALVTGGYLVWDMIGDVGTPSDDEVAEAADRVERSVPADALDAARDVVAADHAQLNEHLGFGGLDQLDLDEFESTVAAPMRERLGDLAAEVDDLELRTDLETVVVLLELATEHGDAEALKLAHRVLHDLDYFAFNPDANGRYWGATVTLEGEANPAQDHLRGHDR